MRKNHAFWGFWQFVWLIGILSISLTTCNNPANTTAKDSSSSSTSGWPITVTNESMYGTVRANKKSAKSGDTIILTIKPSGGYRLGSLSIISGYDPVDYTVLGSETCAFIMPDGAVKISASFATIGLLLHSITISDTANGTIVSEPAEIQRGTASVTLRTKAAKGYKINPASIKVTNGGQGIPIVQSNATTFTFTMPDGDVTVTGAFVSSGTTLQTITVNSTANGVIGVPKAAQAGDTIELALFPNNGYRYKEGSLTVSGASPAAPSGDPLRTSFTMPSNKVTISAKFEAIPAFAVNTTVKGKSAQGSFSVLPYVDGKELVQAGKTAILILNIPNRFEYRYKTNSFAITAGGVTPTEALAGRIWTFTMPDRAVSAEAEVEFIPSNTVTKGDMTNGSVVIFGLKPDGTAPQGATITIQGLPNPGYERTAAPPTITPAGAVTLTADGPNKWRFTMGTTPLTVTMNFQNLGNLVIYRGGLKSGLTPTWLEEGQGYYGGRVVLPDNIEVNAEAEGYNGNTRAIRIYRSTGGPGSSMREIALVFNASTPFDLRTNNVKALSLWVKDNRSAENRFEFYGLGDEGDAKEKAMRTRNSPDNTNTVADTWKQFVVPIPNMTRNHPITRVFFIKCDLEPGDSLLIDNIEFITSYVTPTTRTGVVIPEGNGTITTTMLVYEGDPIHADAILLDRLWVALGDFRVRFSDW